MENIKENSVFFNSERCITRVSSLHGAKQSSLGPLATYRSLSNAELTVEPIRTDREISERYIAAIFARLREVALSRSIAEIKSTLQRLNPTENEAQYNETFSALVAMEAERRVQKDAALGELG